jgi:hypothetical protein
MTRRDFIRLLGTAAAWPIVAGNACGASACFIRLPKTRRNQLRPELIRKFVAEFVALADVILTSSYMYGTRSWLSRAKRDGVGSIG